MAIVHACLTCGIFLSVPSIVEKNCGTDAAVCIVPATNDAWYPCMNPLSPISLLIGPGARERSASGEEGMCPRFSRTKLSGTEACDLRREISCDGDGSAAMTFDFCVRSSFKSRIMLASSLRRRGRGWVNSAMVAGFESLMPVCCDMFDMFLDLRARGGGGSKCLERERRDHRHGEEADHRLWRKRRAKMVILMFLSKGKIGVRRRGQNVVLAWPAKGQ